MVSLEWDESDEAQQALRAIISNPAYGVAALSSPQTMANLLKDLLPDAPREVSILVAAAEAGVAGHLRERVSQGMDVGTASAVVAGSFAASPPFKPEACSWAVGEMAGALGRSRPPARPEHPIRIPRARRRRAADDIEAGHIGARPRAGWLPACFSVPWPGSWRLSAATRPGVLVTAAGRGFRAGHQDERAGHSVPRTRDPVAVLARLAGRPDPRLGGAQADQGPQPGRARDRDRGSGTERPVA